MSCLGVHFALAPRDIQALLAATSDAARLELIQEDIEERYLDEESTYAAQSDKAWDAIHRALTDGKLGYANGRFPLSHVILGGEPLYTSEDYIISLTTVEQVPAIAMALRELSKAQVRAGYDRISETDYGCPLSEEDFEYTWEWLTGLVPFYEAAAASGRPVIFTADQ